MYIPMAKTCIHMPSLNIQCTLYLEMQRSYIISDLFLEEVHKPQRVLSVKAQTTKTLLKTNRQTGGY